MTLVLVLPALLGLLPNPALSAIPALDRDIAVSLCAASGTNDPAGKAQHPLQHEACILCGMCAAVSGSAPGDAASTLLAVPRTPAAWPHPVAARFRPLPSLLLFGHPPRGPPSVLTA